jgi:hypothetical protein
MLICVTAVPFKRSSEEYAFFFLAVFENSVFVISHVLYQFIEC